MLFRKWIWTCKWARSQKSTTQPTNKKNVTFYFLFNAHIIIN